MNCWPVQPVSTHSMRPPAKGAKISYSRQEVTSPRAESHSPAVKTPASIS